MRSHLPLLRALPDGRPFVAIDFETADYQSDSACAVGLVRVEDGAIVARHHALIRPPRRWIRFTHIHGITWEMVKDEPGFADVWNSQSDLLEDVAAFVAHNAGFDRGVLSACCAAAGLEPPPLPFACTVQIAKSTWGQRPNDLKTVCARLRIALDHHHALSDAEACAHIVLAAQKAVRALAPSEKT